MKEHYNQQAQPNIALYGAEADLYARAIAESKPVTPPVQDTTAVKAQTRPQA